MKDEPKHQPVLVIEDVVPLLEALSNRAGIAEGYVQLYLDLALAQAKIHQQLAQNGAGAKLLEASSTAHARLEPGDVPLDQQLLDEYFSTLCSAVAEHGVETSDLVRLKLAAAQDPDLLQGMIRDGLLNFDEDCLRAVAERLEIPDDVLHYFAHLLAAPFVAFASAGHPCSNSSEPVEPDDDARGCRCCGSPAAMSRLTRDDGKRILICSLCGTEWSYPRIKCPYCACTDQAKLGMLFIDKADPRWIETCDHCKQYMKVFDERKAQPDEKFIPYVEEVATLYLDLLAEKKGYFRKLPYAPCLTTAVVKSQAAT